MTIFDLDDFLFEHTHLDDLDRLHLITGCKVTLFTIPQPCNPEHAACSGAVCVPTLHDTVSYILRIRQTRPWMEFALHGYSHMFLECRHWSYDEALRVLMLAEETNVFVKGFKAPYWETSAGLYKALLERGWWIADHDRNDALRPQELRVYKIVDGSVHGHVQDIGSNGLRESWLQYIVMRPPYSFISEVMA